MTRSNRTLAIVCAAVLGVGATVTLAQQAPDDGPRYENGTQLVRPDNYREWVFLGAGLGMTYEEDTADGVSSEELSQLFTNVFVNPSSYRGFMETGVWPDRTTFVLEFRQSASEVSINRAGRFQTDLFMLEAEVKDARFPDGWAFFDFGRAGELAEAAEPLAGERVAPCIECHTLHTAVERTFVQFYPTALEAAREHGTLKPGF